MKPICEELPLKASDRTAPRWIEFSSHLETVAAPCPAACSLVQHDSAVCFTFKLNTVPIYFNGHQVDPKHWEVVGMASGKESSIMCISPSPRQTQPFLPEMTTPTSREGFSGVTGEQSCIQGPMAVMSRRQEGKVRGRECRSMLEHLCKMGEIMGLIPSEREGDGEEEGERRGRRENTT